MEQPVVTCLCGLGVSRTFLIRQAAEVKADGAALSSLHLTLGYNRQGTKHKTGFMLKHFSFIRLNNILFKYTNISV
jgi:hypothetical protein